ncbi:flagellar export chaperone FlgN [Chromobacterium alticapitis]|uniref:Flagellar biosynthesis protein FlgN n=1 Tax=Chromobacterium alticapitis TaxID=2073169 RepID=A0A2S5DJY1_9NEIS|nr:flagellar export chaperone FlgN [Chromobacterium alticapitis]POZ63390.1 flagellar biosynthesis protein FlgN [Chromobacterium alticapitis]
MDKRQAYRQLFGTIAEDLTEYQRLLARLEAQFRAALEHDAAALAMSADEIAESCVRLERSRRARLELVRGLLPAGAEASMTAALAVLPPALRDQAGAHWQRLRGLIAECRESNLRNGHLLQQRRELLQRVLVGESDVYLAQ